ADEDVLLAVLVDVGDGDPLGTQLVVEDDPLPDDLGLLGARFRGRRFVLSRDEGAGDQEREGGEEEISHGGTRWGGGSRVDYRDGARGMQAANGMWHDAPGRGRSTMIAMHEGGRQAITTRSVVPQCSSAAAIEVSPQRVEMRSARVDLDEIDLRSPSSA